MNIYLRILTALAICLLPGAGRANTYFVSFSGKDSNSGTAAAPWRTLQHAVDTVKPGDTVLIGPGIYREQVQFRHGGTRQAPLILAALPGARAVISGADRLHGGWSKVEATPEAIYVHDWPYRFPIGGPNELTHPNDKEHELTGRAEQVLHEGRLLRQVLRREQLAPGTFFADLEDKKLYVWLRGSDDPNQTEMEASVRSNWFVAPSASYVHVRGLIFRYAANHAQRGALTIGREEETDPTAIARGWLVEDCVFERANGPGASLSGQGHVFRRCLFQDNGQLGFGASRCHNTRMEQCGLYRNNTKGYSTGWEAGGCKVSLSRGFHFDGCRAVDNRGPGIWFDIGNEKAEVTHCYLADNDDAGLFYEISYGLDAHDNLIVNNANNREEIGGAWGMGGITLSSSEDCVVEHNTLVGNRDGIAFREQERTTPRINAPEGAKEVRILNKNDLIRDNIVAYSQSYNIALWMDTNFFGPHPNGEDKNAPLFEGPNTLNIRFENNLLWPLPGRANYLYGVPWRPKSQQLSTVRDFTAAAGIPDTSRIVDPLFKDMYAGDFRLQSGSPALTMGVGLRDEAHLPQR